MRGGGFTGCVTFACGWVRNGGMGGRRGSLNWGDGWCLNGLEVLLNLGVFY